MVSTGIVEMASNSLSYSGEQTLGKTFLMVRTNLQYAQ